MRDGRRILPELQRLLRDRFPQIGEDTHLGEEVGLLGHGIGLDSVEALALANALEEAFSIEIDDDALRPEAFESVGSVVCLIDQHLDGA